MQKYQETVISAIGRPVIGATVRVTTLAGAAATIYSDNGVTPISSLVTDSTGSFGFYAADGRYTVTISGSGFPTRVISDVLLEDPVDGGQSFARSTDLVAAPASQMADRGVYRVLKDDSGGPGGEFYWDATGDHSDDGGIVKRVADRPTGPGILKRIYEPVVRLDWFDCPGLEGVDVGERVNKAIKSAMEFGRSALFVPPGVYSLDRGLPIVIPGDFELFGTYGRSVFKSIGTNWPVSPSFPDVGNGMICTGNPQTLDRYLTETGRVARGTGLTANLTVSGGAVTGATVAAGGTNWITGDSVYFGVFPSQARFTVTATTYRGAATDLTLVTGGTGWGAPANPVAMNFSTGMQGWDRVLDPATLGGPVSIHDLVIDGDWGGAQAKAILAAGKTYKGIQVIGHSMARVKNVIAKRFPNGAIAFQDNVSWECTDNYCEDNGWRGYNGDRNALSNAGLYVTTNGAVLNSRKVLIARNRINCTGDVAIEHHWFEGQIVNNQIWDWGSIGIEGQASSYDSSGEKFSNNGGVVIPSDLVIADNGLDATRYTSAAWADVNPPVGVSDGTSNRAAGVDAISCFDGNEGVKVIRNNTIRGALRRIIYAVQGNGGQIHVLDNVAVNCGSMTPNIQTGTVCQLQGREVYVKRNDFRGDVEGSRPMQGTIFNINGQGEVIEVESNHVYGVGFSPVLQVTYFGTPYAAKLLKFNRNVVQEMWGSAVFQWQQTGSNSAALQKLEIKGNTVMGIANNAGNALFATAPHFDVSASPGQTLDIVDVDIQDNSYETVFANHINATSPIFSFNATSLSPWRNFTFRNNRAAGFQGGAAMSFKLHAFGANQTMPDNVRVEHLDPVQGVVSLVDSAAVTPNVGLSRQFAWTIGGNRTLTNPLNARTGDKWTVEITQDATGSRLLSFGTLYKAAGGSLPVLSTGAGKLDILQCEYDGSRVVLSALLDVR